MIKYRTIWSANTDPYISVHISTSYSTSIQKQSYKTLHKFYVRLGRLVVSISPSQEVSAQRTLRNTLIAIILCHEYIKTVPFVRSAYIRKSSLKAFINLKKRRYMRMKISDLLILCVRSVALSRLLMLGGRLSLLSFPSVEASTFYLMPNLNLSPGKHSLKKTGRISPHFAVKHFLRDKSKADLLGLFLICFNDITLDISVIY